MRAILSIFCSLLILITSTGFTVSSHYCGGKRVKSDVSFVESDVSCGMQEEETSCGDTQSLKSNCCQNEYQHFQLEEDYSSFETVKKVQNLKYLKKPVLNVWLPSHLEKIEYYNDYSPPPLIKDISVLFRIFRI